MDKELEELISDFEESLSIIETMIADDEGLSDADIFRLEEVIFRHKVRTKNGDLDEIKELPKALERSQDNETDAWDSLREMKEEIKTVLSSY